MPFNLSAKKLWHRCLETMPKAVRPDYVSISAHPATMILLHHKNTEVAKAALLGTHY